MRARTLAVLVFMTVFFVWDERRLFTDLPCLTELDVDHLVPSSQRSCPTWSAPCILCWSSHQWPTVRVTLLSASLVLSFIGWNNQPINSFSALCLGCKVESIYLHVEAVNTHRDRPEVGTRPPAPPHAGVPFMISYRFMEVRSSEMQLLRRFLTLRLWCNAHHTRYVKTRMVFSNCNNALGWPFALFI